MMSGYGMGLGMGFGWLGATLVLVLTGLAIAAPGQIPSQVATGELTWRIQ